MQTTCTNHTNMPHIIRLCIGAFNINANKTNCYDSKVQHSDFDHISKGLDIIGLTETHAASEQEIQKQGFHHYSSIHKKAQLARSHSRGITVLVANHLAPHTKMCDWSNPSCLTIRIQGQAINQPSDLYVLTVSLPPEHSSYLRSTYLNRLTKKSPPMPIY